jgi:hypothetical protein
MRSTGQGNDGYNAADQQIGTVGARCNRCTPALGPHLHFEVRYIPTAIDPESYPIVDPYGLGGWWYRSALQLRHSRPREPLAVSQRNKFFQLALNEQPHVFRRGVLFFLE